MATDSPDPPAAPIPPDASPAPAPPATTVLDLNAPLDQTSAEFNKIVEERPNVDLGQVQSAAGAEKANVFAKDKAYAPATKLKTARGRRSRFG
jgi:hypothetical protein